MLEPKIFMKRPVHVEAIQWTGDNFDSCDDFIKCQKEILPRDGIIRIHTLEGVMTTQLDDWIIKGVEDEFYPCKPDIFEKTYVLVGD